MADQIDHLKRLRDHAVLVRATNPALDESIDFVLATLEGYEKGWTARAGREAEELRQGIEKLVSKWNGGDYGSLEERQGLLDGLRELLDQVDARDSLRWLEYGEVARIETRAEVSALLLGMVTKVGTVEIPMSSNHVSAAQSILRQAIERIEKMARKPQKERWDDEDVMLYPGARRQSFRCECGSNVFRKSLDVPLHYRCNGCSATYTGEGYDDGPADKKVTP